MWVGDTSVKSKLARAIQLRNNKCYKESNELFIKLVEAYPNHASINFQCAWSYDVLGEEAKAIPFYEQAIHLGLPRDEMEKAILGLGSTYRTLGKYEKSQEVFLKGIELFPNNRAIQVFYSMTLYNLNEHNKAMELLLNCLIETTSDQDILGYKKAISFYYDKLDKVWD